MTVSSELSRSDYAGNGSTVNFATGFRFLDNTHVRVILTSSIGVETVQVLNTDYTLSGVGLDAGGTVAMTTAPATGETLTVKRDVPNTQLTDYVENDPFPAESHEEALDKLTMIVQQQQEELDRALKLTESQQSSGLQIPIPVEDNLLRWDADGNLENIVVSQLGAVTTADLDDRHGVIFATVAAMTAASPVAVDGSVVSLVPGMRVHVLGNITAGDGGHKNLLVTAPQAVDGFGSHLAANGNALILQRTNGIATPEQYGATSYPADSTANIRAALDEGPVQFGLKTYGVDNLQIKKGDILLGSGAYFWQTAANKPADGAVTYLRYAGAGGVNSVAVRASTEAVGTRPTFQTDGSQDTFGWVMKNMVVDGNDLAEFGLYGARCGLGTWIENVFVTGCEKHGAWIGEFWTAKVPSLYAIWNGGAGITLGKDTFSWGANAVNSVEFGTLQAFANDQDGNFNETTAISDGYGIGWLVGRSCICHSMIVESNKGPGLYTQPTSGPNTITSLYTEGNGVQAVTDLRATRNYGMIFDSLSSSVSQKISQVHKSGAADQFWWNTGTEPGTSSLEGLEIDSVFGGLSILSDWSNYKLGSQIQTTTLRDILGNFPENNEPDSIDTTGRSGGAVTTLFVRTGGAGTEGGLNTANAMATIQEAIQVASIITTVTTIDIGTFAATDVVVDAKRLTREITIDGKNTAAITQSATNTVSFDLTNSRARLTLKDFAPQRVRFSDCHVVLDNIDATQTAADSSSTSLCVVRKGSHVEMVGSAIDVTLSASATKRALELGGNSRVSMEDSSSLIGATAGNSILIQTGGGVLLTDTTAAWTTDVNSAISTAFMLQNPTGIQLGSVRLIS